MVTKVTNVPTVTSATMVTKVTNILLVVWVTRIHMKSLVVTETSCLVFCINKNNSITANDVIRDVLNNNSGQRL